MKNFLIAAVIGGLALGCSRDTPTRSITPLPTSEPGPMGADVTDADTIERQTEQLRALFDEMTQMGRGALLRAQTEDFTCTNVEEVRVRFSDPGFVDNLDVGLFVKFIGIPAGTKKLRIWWDYDNEFDRYQDVEVGEGDVNPETSGRFDVEMVIEHSYDLPGRRRVRVELILSGSKGNCARNREIVVAPNATAPGANIDHIVTFAGVPTCVAFFGSRSMGMWANFNPPIPAGTPYSVTFRVAGTGVLAPSMTIAMAGNTAGPDTVSPPPLIAPPPNDFSVAMSPTVDHAQLQIATQIFSFAFVTPTSMRTSILAIDVPGKTVLIVDNLEGNCP